MTISISEKLLVAVRGEPVWMFYEDNERGTVYVPSRRMRELLIDWLNRKYD